MRESAGQCRIYRTMSEEYGQAGFEVFAGKIIQYELLIRDRCGSEGRFDCR